VVTRCATAEEFFSSFRPFVDDTSVFIPTRSPRPVGTRQAFLIQLKDGQPMLRGQGEVIESFPEAGEPKRVGMRLHILSLDTASQAMFARLMEHKRAPTLPPPFRGSPTGQTVRFLVPPMPAPPERATESRVPGASYTLPANPFSELPPEALEHFIDCTIYEDTGQARAPAPPSSLMVASSIPTPISSDGTDRVEPLPPGPLRKKPNAVMVALVSIGAAVVGLVGGWILWGPQSSLPPTRPGAPVAPVAETQPQPVPVPAPVPDPVVPVAAAVAPTPETEEHPEPPALLPAPVPPPAPAPMPAPPTSECVATFDTEPDGADVSVNGNELGKTPLVSAGVPCGALAVVITHPRYERVERTVQATGGKAVTLRQRLLRPEATLEVRSSPAGATVLVHGENIGRAPARVKLDGFTTYKITATLEGHKVWSHSVYVKGRRMAVTARLEAMETPGKARWRPGPSAGKQP